MTDSVDRREIFGAERGLPHLFALQVRLTIAV